MLESKILSVVFYVFGGIIALFLAYVNGKRAERIRQLKSEAEKTVREQEIKNEIESNVSNMSMSDVRERLQNIKRK